MAKIKARFYAQALYDLTAGKAEKDWQAATVSMLELLKKNKQLKLWPQVIEAYLQLLNERQGLMMATVRTEKELTPADEKRIKDFLQQESQAKEVELTVVQEKIGPGLIVETREKRWDLSLDNQIENFKKQLIS